LVGLRIAVVAVVAAEREFDGTSSESSRLALNARQLAVPLDDQVAPGVLAERQVEAIAEPLQYS
jgi:hypothetical protein